MMPHQNPRNAGRSQPSALRFSGANSFLTNRSTPPTLPGPASPDPKNDAFRADVRPDFMHHGDQARQAPIEPARADTPRTISEQYNQARQQLTAFEPLKGYATEKQRRDFAWEVRSNPMGARDAAQDFQRTYNRGPAAAQTPPSRPTNFNGPRPRFSA